LQGSASSNCATECPHLGDSRFSRDHEKSYVKGDFNGGAEELKLILKNTVTDKNVNIRIRNLDTNKERLKAIEHI
jgi:hypothetical protein